MFFLIVRWIKMAFHAVQHARRQWAPELQQLNDHIEKLEQSLAGTDDCVLDIYSLEERHGTRIDILEEELTSIKTDIADLKDHLASVIKELDVITNGGIEEELASVKTCLIALTKEFDAHKNAQCPMPKEIKHYFKTMVERDETIMDRDEVDRGATPPPGTTSPPNSPTKGYNLRSHVIDIE